MLSLEELFKLLSSAGNVFGGGGTSLGTDEPPIANKKYMSAGEALANTPHQFVSPQSSQNKATGQTSGHVDTSSSGGTADTVNNSINSVGNLLTGVGKFTEALKNLGLLGNTATDAGSILTSSDASGPIMGSGGAGGMGSSALASTGPIAEETLSNGIGTGASAAGEGAGDLFSMFGKAASSAV